MRVTMLHGDDERKTSTTIAPLAGPTIRPTFDVEELARQSGFRTVSSLLSDSILEIVPDVSWLDARLDLVETEILAQIDGVSPVALIESMTRISRDELYATLGTLLARGFMRVIVAPEAAVAPPPSGLYARVPAVEGLVADDSAAWACTG